MKIIFKQSENNGASLEKLGIYQCYCKKIFVMADKSLISRKAHHHNGFEIHIMENGHQIYSIGKQRLTLEKGQMLVIPPGVRHCVEESSPNASKFSLSFRTAPQSLFEAIRLCAVADVPSRILENLCDMEAENERRRSMSEALVGAWVVETIILLFRTLGVKERVAQSGKEGADPRYLLAMQYIQDNIEHAPTVPEVAAYCGLSERQLSRIFHEEGTSPAETIRHGRIRRIEVLLADATLSLGAISEKMSFSDEYYFNAFFKKHAGMTPGAYRKMLL